MSKLRFLCPTHRDWLGANPEAAHALWQSSRQRSLELLEEQDFTAAARHAGAAYEAAGILLSQDAAPAAPEIGRFTDATALLGELLLILGEREAARLVNAAAISRMEQLLVSGVHRRLVLACCERLLGSAAGTTPQAQALPVSTSLH